MSVEEELQETAEEVKHPFDRRVAASMAVIAAALAIVAVLGHFTSTEEVLLQQKASDQWAFAQAKSLGTAHCLLLLVRASSNRCT